ncbi:MAG: hypothetical protein AMXMBFR36_04620 [Acidobacteriota bacterium]
MERVTGSALALGLLLTAPLAAQGSPYVGDQEQRIKALATEREQGLRAGAGLGLALAAELNGHAGPKHVLELAAELGLTAGQRPAIEASFERMRTEAVALGEQIVAAEEELDRRFAHRHLDEAKLAELTARIGELEGRLRFVHLRAHLETDAILTAAQRARYVELRGYGGSGGAHVHGEHGATPHGGHGGS